MISLKKKWFSRIIIRKSSTGHFHFHCFDYLIRIILHLRLIDFSWKFMEVRGVDCGGGIGDGFGGGFVDGFVDDGGGVDEASKVVWVMSRGFNIESIRNNYKLWALETLPGGGEIGEDRRFRKGFGLLGLMSFRLITFRWSFWSIDFLKRPMILIATSSLRATVPFF